MYRRNLIPGLICIFCVVLAGCGVRAAIAKQELKRMGLSFTQESFLNSVETHDAKAVGLFLQAGMSADARNADSSRTMKLVSMMKDSGPDPEMSVQDFMSGKKFVVHDETQWTALMLAASKGDLEILKALLDAGADANAAAEYGGTALMAAAVNNAKYSVGELLNAGANKNAAEKQKGFTAVSLAAGNGANGSLEKLIDAGCDLKTTGKFGAPILHLAAASGSKETVDLLLGARIALESTDRNGQTPLHWAAAKPDSNMVQFLIDKGARVNAVDGNNETPLYVAAANGLPEIAQVLIRAGANVNIVNKSAVPHSVLLAAALKGNEDVVRLLIRSGANVSQALALAQGESFVNEDASHAADLISDVADGQSSAPDLPVAKIKAFRFFEGAQYPPPAKQRQYTDRFPQSKTRSIWWQLDINMPAPHRSVQIRLSHRWFRVGQNSALSCSDTVSLQVNSNLSNVFTEAGCGGNAGAWRPGKYQVDVSSAGEAIAQGMFEVYDDSLELP